MKHVAPVLLLAFLACGFSFLHAAESDSSSATPTLPGIHLALAEEGLPAEQTKIEKMGKPESFPSLSENELKEHWEAFSKEKDFGALLKDVAGKGFQRIKAKEAAWGLKGEFVDAKGKSTPFLFCAYDFYNPKLKGGQGCTMIYKWLGGRTYKAYMVFPEGEKDVRKALDGAKEWFVDGNATVQQAHSFARCFPRCVATSGSIPGLDVDIKNGKVKIGGSTFTISCMGTCGIAAALCGTSVTVITLATGGITVPVAIAVLLGCAGPCAGCLALCALGCM